MRRYIILYTALLVTACNGASRPSPKATIIPPAISASGLDRVLGHTARELVQLFGASDFEQREGPGLKLQFASNVCVLDAYLYPPAPGREPVVRYIDARQITGEDIDRVSCIAALTRRKEAR
jgi:hypothetical protein